MYAHYYKNGLMPESEIDIWFRRHLRLYYRYQPLSEYAKRIGETEAHVLAVYAGRSLPKRSILEDMKMIEDKHNGKIVYRSIGDKPSWEVIGKLYEELRENDDT